MKFIYTLLFVFISFSMIAQNGNEPGKAQLDMAIDLFNSKEYEDGLMILDIAISKGNAEAMLLKGDMYYDGKGIEQNFKQAYTFYKSSSEKGNYEAMTKFGKMHMDTLVPGRSYSDALDILKKLYHKGNYKAAAIIGKAYYDGWGYEKNVDSAFYWLNAGIEKEDYRSEFYLGQINLNEKTDKESQEIAVNMIDEACANNIAEACVYLGYISYKGEFIEKDLDGAKNCFKTAIELDSPIANYYMALMIYNREIEGTKKEAIAYVDKAKKLGHSAKDCDILRLNIYSMNE